jgi:hypothetical protein
VSSESASGFSLALGSRFWRLCTTWCDIAWSVLSSGGILLAGQLKSCSMSSLEPDEDHDYRYKANPSLLFLTPQGNNATGDCCSKCWAQIRPKEEVPKKEEPAQPPAASNDELNNLTVKSEAAAPTPAAPATTALEETKVTSESVPTATASEAVDDMASPAKKKKKKKTSYKSMMAGMLEGTGVKDAEKEKEKLRDGMGGGHFKKIDHI